MTTAEMTIIAGFGIPVLILLVLGVILMTGHGAMLIAGYNTMSLRERETYDSKRMCKFVGKLLLLLAISFAVIGAGVLLDVNWVLWVGIAFIAGAVIFAILYMNAGDRFKKKVQ
ncbi:MAG: DUF3784 domain-containing protein [Oscillospiraceae bacterium]|jgi:hypothetical protein|nr:DUF3784 domain-containing protein [Oscillospiraceae bacterium]